MWHEGLFHRIFQYGIRGNVYELIKSLYSKNSCSVKIGKCETSKFSYCRGVRQGSILSPLFFNLFVNKVPLSFNCNKTDTFHLLNGTKLNSLLYADDLVIISKSKYGFNNCLKTLETFDEKWLLNVNFKKTKIFTVFVVVREHVLFYFPCLY